MKKPGEHGGRLVIRNLPFGYTLKQIQKLTSAIGVVKDLNMPWDEVKKRNKGFAFVEYEKKNLSSKAIKSLNGKTIQHRVLSVDWALSKTHYEKALKSEESAIEFKPKIVPEPTEPDLKEEKPEPEVETEAKIVPAKQPANRLYKDQTLFVKNLTYEVDDDDLKDFFTQFGPLKYAKVVYSKETNQSKGTGFICFNLAKDAQSALEQLGEGKEAGPEMELEGRIPVVCLAVSRDEAVKITPKKPQVSDKRNLHLSREGVIMPGTQEFDALSPEEIERRMAYARSKNQKLKNPNVFVSKTRVLLRNIPKSVDEKRLKDTCRKLLYGLDPELAKKKLFSQVKILRETEKTDEDGNQRSKGIGFVEFREHQNALKCIREISKNPTLFGHKKTVIAEFALDDVRMMRLRNLRLERQKKKSEELKHSIETFPVSKPEKPSRGKRQRLKRKQLKESSPDQFQSEQKLPSLEELNTFKPTKSAVDPVPEKKRKRHQPKKSKGKLPKDDVDDIEVIDFDEETPRKRRKEGKSEEDSSLERLVSEYRNKLFASVGNTS